MSLIQPDLCFAIVLLQLLAKYQRDQGIKAQESQEGEAVLSEGQASQTLHF